MFEAPREGLVEVKKKLIYPTWVPALVFVLGCAGADTGLDEQPSPDPEVVAGSRNDDPHPGEDTGGGQGAASTDRPQLCEMVTMEEVSAITGGKYASFEQQADYATLTHCGYIGGSGGGDVSMLYASGDYVPTRWDSAHMTEVTLVEGFWEEAVWEPGTGTLTAKSGDMLVEIGISKSLAEDGQEQIELSKQLAELVASKF